ncbi:MAG: LTA synthase family protein [Bacteroidota bacterium]
MRLILSKYILVLSLFSAFRLLLLTTEGERLVDTPAEAGQVGQALFIGLRFDIVITGYLLSLPILLLVIAEVSGLWKKGLIRFCFYWTLSFFALAFLICAIDIPYFNQFFSRFDVVAFNWADQPFFVGKMMLQEPRYFGALLFYLIVLLLFYLGLKRIYQKAEIEAPKKKLLKLSLYLPLLLLVFVGIRGRLASKSPIRIGTAYFSNNAFLNQLGLNPVFTLIKSYSEQKKKSNRSLQLMDEEEAIQAVQADLNIQQNIGKSPIARKIQPNLPTDHRPNVVLILMESMSTAKMGRYGNPHGLTPFLDSISQQSLYFENIYTAGIHTFNGIFSTLCSFPALMRQQPLKKMKRYNGMATTLRQLDYATLYFTTHDAQFDNVAGFLYANDMERIVSQADYPREAIKTALGVPDDVMFHFSLPILEEYAAKGQPFFATFMTASDHGPFYIPPYFQKHSENIRQQIVAYADWSLQQFIRQAATKSWFDQTIFIFIADHGAPMNTVYDLALNYHHSPLIFYAPKLLGTPKSYHQMGGQIDVFPTLMGLLNLPYTNNTLGIDLRKEERPYIYFSADDKIGVLDQEHFLMINPHQAPQLFQYRNKDLKNYSDLYPEKVASMKQYMESHLQVYQYLLSNDLLYQE